MDPKSYFYQFLPLGGNNGVAQVATIGVSSLPTSVDLRSIFGSIDNGDGITIKAIQTSPNLGVSGFGGSWRALFSLTEKSTPISNESLLTPGTASGAQSWALMDGQERFGHLTSGRILGTGLATMMQFPVLNVATPGASFGTGLFKIMRTTLVGVQDASRFQQGIPGLPTAMAAPSQMFGYPLPSGYQSRP